MIPTLTPCHGGIAPSASRPLSKQPPPPNPLSKNTGPPLDILRHLHRFLAWCIDSQIPELLTLAATIDTWWPEINAFVQTGITNARTEGYNRLVKQVKRG